MLAPHEVTDMLRQHLAYLSSEYGVTRLGLFGSYAKGSPHEHSDIDLVAEFETPPGLRFVELTEYLEDLFHSPVDVLTPVGIRGIRNEQVSKDIQESIVYV